MNGGPSGFQNAPVTRTIVIASALLTILLGVKGRSSKLGLSYEEVFQNFHMWRLIASLFTFSSTPELIFGLYLLRYFSVFERQIGSNKHSVFILFSILASLLFQLLALAYLKEGNELVGLLQCGNSHTWGRNFWYKLKEGLVIHDGDNLIATPPFTAIVLLLLFTSLFVLLRFRIYGIGLTDKSFIYFAGLQVLFSSWKRSLVPGLCGLLSGSLYRLNLLGIRKIKFPEFVTSFISRLSLPSRGVLPNMISSVNFARNIPSHLVHQTESHQPSAIASLPEPPETSVAQLISMGFDRSSARLALIRARNDISLATNILLEAQSH